MNAEIQSVESLLREFEKDEVQPVGMVKSLQSQKTLLNTNIEVYRNYWGTKLPQIIIEINSRISNPDNKIILR